ncbi:MAG: serine--tRNA ligase [Christensenellales bacterium]|jgi:seryl-tRNA synthetase
MLDLRWVVDNLERVKENLAARNIDFSLEGLTDLAYSRRRLIASSEEKKAQKNAASAQIAVLKREKKDASELIAQMKALGEEIKAEEEELAAVMEKITVIIEALPNMLSPDVPGGSSDADNVEVRRTGAPREFSFAPLAHWDIGENLKILNFEQAAKITGARFTVYHGLGARLERAVINLMLDTHAQKGYKEIFPPFMVNRDSAFGTGQLPKFADTMYGVEGTGYYLIPTAEVPVTNLHRGDILDITDLPIKYCAYSACFRQEAGAAGRDTRGLIRQHQFNKVELVKFAHPDTSYEELESLTADAEDILKILGLPYRVVVLCSADVGASSAKTYDIEVYMPSYGRYVEISSCSNFEAYQARRANIKFRGEDNKTRFVHTLNGSGLAVGRTVAAILENYQNEDGSVTVPDALVKYMGTKLIK